MKALPPVPSADLEHILCLAEDDLRALSGCRLFVTGGTGFFGTWLLEAFAAANLRLSTRIDVHILSRDISAFALRKPHLAERTFFRWHQGDVMNYSFPEGTFDHMIHAATAASAALNSHAPKAMFDTIVRGTERVLEHALSANTKSLLMTSSGAVYGRQPADLALIPETFPGGPDPLNAGSAYAEGKRAAELLCATTTEVDTKIARCFAFIGPHLPLDAHFAAGNFLRDALAANDIVIHGDGRPLRSYLHAADLVIWLLAILNRGQARRAYNVGSDQAVSIKGLADHIASHADQPISVRVLSPASSHPAERYIPCTERAREELGLKQCISLDESIARTLRWLKDR